MPGEDLHDEGAAAGARSGRHAAPRKPLLTRLHVPAGKAIAIAAMPSAVLMGMGLTPQLAMAKPKPESPFKDGPCVTVSDKADQQEEDAEAKKKAEEEAKEKAEAEKKAEEGAKDGSPSAEPSASPSPSGKDEDGTSEPSSGETAEPDASPSPSASEEEKKNPLDPLGVGDALGKLLGVDKDEDDEATASPSPSASASESQDSASKDAGSATDKVTKPVEDTVDGVKDTVGKAGDAAKDVTGTAKDTVDGAYGQVENNLPGGGLDGKDTDGKKAYPCVVEKKVAGEDETTPAVLPDDPWHLESSALTLRGLDYAGVVNIKTHNGSTKQALKFTADSVDIGDLHQIVDGPDGKKYHVQGAKGSTSTIRGGKVTMYTERLQGNLFGLIPVVFDPEHPPPINTPFAMFTKVKIDQAGQFGGNLHIPGLHQSITD